MRRLSSLIFGLLCTILFVGISPIHAQDYDFIKEEKIQLFEVNLTLEENTDVRINERIYYYFPFPKHGIYRTIPINKRDKGNALKTPTSIKVNSVKYYPSENISSISTSYEKETDFGREVNIKIGDAEKTIQGLYIYEINYTVRNGINYFEDHDELHWNIIGTGWTVPIEKVQATISLPGIVEKTACYTGRYGEKGSNCEFTPLSDTSVSLSNKETLSSNEAVTIAIAMPKGSIEDVREAENIRIKKVNTFSLLALLLIPIFFFSVFKKIKSPKLTIIPEYTPPKGINPLISGYLLSKGIPTPKAITAEIINLAVNGHIEIEQVGKKEYILRKINHEKIIEPTSSNLLSDALFSSSDEINTKKKTSSLGTEAKNIWDQAKKDAEAKSYLDKKKATISAFAIVFAIILFIGNVMGIPFLSMMGFGVAGAIMLITSFSIFIMTFLLDSRTEVGNKVYYELQGLKIYIKTAEKHRIEFHNDPKKYRGVFEKLLPYAILFGLEKKWIKEFKDIYTEQPDWYRGDMSTFNAYLLMDSISSVNSGITTPAFQSGGGFSSGGSGFGGGGFSGGGGGGGGGGSW
jgi:uncharacterized membrane protein YgcG